MATENRNIAFLQLEEDDQKPYDLLLLADPSRALVEAYVSKSAIFIAKLKDEIIGVVVLFPISKSVAEIKNIAVTPAFQRQGVGQFLIENVLAFAKNKMISKMLIGTANSSLGQLHLYQKLGFEITEIRKEFFINNYPEPLYENGIQAKHMIMLTKEM